MAREYFRDWNPNDSTRALVAQCAQILEELSAYRLTLRQLYYQLVSRNIITNEERSYKNLSRAVTRARLAGILDWDAIEDRVRQPDFPPEFNNLKDLVEAALRSYRLPRWDGQEYYAELWVEKDALASVLRPLARKYHVVLMVNRGYSSASAMYDAAKRFLDHRDQDCTLFYLGDLDPSGEDMVRDISDRLAEFNADVQVEKIALTMEQVQEHQPPPNPAKITDPRAADFIARYGHESWEVDALPPAVLEQLISEKIESVLDLTLYSGVIQKEERDKRLLKKTVAGLEG